jgi:ferredoxin/flavodoxin---NADP+ reductase
MDSFRVLENVRLSRSTFRLRTERPDVPIRAGQCFSVGTKELGINREYSMYSAADDPFVDFLIREVDDGIVTPALARCKPGDLVEIGGPYGDFCLPIQAIAEDPFVFIASGTGIAPFHSYVKSFPWLDYKIFHGIRHEDETYEKDSYSVDRYVAAVSQPSNGSPGQRVTDVLRSVDLNPEARYYLCGNRSMIVDAVRILRDGGVPGGRILMETFF